MDFSSFTEAQVDPLDFIQVGSAQSAVPELLGRSGRLPGLPEASRRPPEASGRPPEAPGVSRPDPTQRRLRLLSIWL
jgi:hypothetical protein